MKTERLATDQ